ncbi:MAG: hypothetical protein MJ224_07530 [archaeon]|nr:hypothetical protein [archaeon]
MSNYIEKSNGKEMLCKNRIKELLYKVKEDGGKLYLSMVDNCGLPSINSVGTDHIEVINKNTEFIIGDDYLEIIKEDSIIMLGKYGNEPKKHITVLPFNQIVMIEYKKKIKGENTNSKDNGSCYIATYVYGNYDASEVLILRKFRDEKLLTNSIGTVFVKFYYKVSPFLIKHFGGKIFKKTTKKILNYIIKKIN